MLSYWMRPVQDEPGPRSKHNTKQSDGLRRLWGVNQGWPTVSLTPGKLPAKGTALPEEPSEQIKGKASARSLPPRDRFSSHRSIGLHERPALRWLQRLRSHQPCRRGAHPDPPWAPLLPSIPLPSWPRAPGSDGGRGKSSGKGGPGQPRGTQGRLHPPRLSFLLHLLLPDSSPGTDRIDRKNDGFDLFSKCF